MIVIGTPAEEAAGGKVYMIDRGGFRDIDCAMMVHPGNRDTSIAYALACLEFDVEFIGRPAHAAARPEAGLNALDAMVQAFVAIGLLRQQVRDSARIHGIITDGGQAVNVIPHHTQPKFLVRTEEDEYMDQVLKPKVLACFEGAALATGCELKYHWGEESRYKTMRTNMALAEAYRANVESLGRKTVMPDSKRSMGSTDMGNVSQVVPGIHPGDRDRAVGRSDPHRGVPGVRPQRVRPPGPARRREGDGHDRHRCARRPGTAQPNEGRV